MNPEPSRPSVRTLALIVVGNLIPVVGVLFLGWNAAQIVILYWCENVVIGALTLPRILTAQKVVRYPDRPGQIQLDNAAGKGCLGLFFMVHYGIFCIGHLVFAVLLLSGAFGGDGGAWESGRRLWPETLGDAGFRWAVLAVALIHGVRFLHGWVLTGGYRLSDPGTEMMRPYDRIIIMHLTVLFGAWALAAIGAPASAVLTLCAVKTLFEIRAAFPKKEKPGAPSDDGDGAYQYDV